MSSFDLDTIRYAISSRMQQGRLALSNPSAIVAALATTALFSLLPEGTLSQPLLDSILINIIGGGLGVSALYDFLKEFIDNLQTEEENQYTAHEIRQRFEQALLERLEESGHSAHTRVLRADVSRLLRHVEGINVALSAAPSELRQPLVDSFIELGSNFEEFRWILIEQSQLLMEVRQHSQDIKSYMQRLQRQVARLEQNQQALPVKLKLLLLFQSERSACPHPDPLPTLGEGESPYKGLPAFQKEDAGYFFGREEQVVDLVYQLAQDKRFLAVIGPSGSGKSSLVRAGLLSQLDSDTAHQLLHSRDWRTVIVKPGSNPIAALANGVGSLSINIASRALLGGLQDSPDELGRVIQQQLLHNQPLHVRLLLIVDQFEELFRPSLDESERLRFIESLLHVSQSTACRTIVLLTMRADFYGHCASHPRLRSQIQDHHLLVGPLHESELRRVIELPANKMGLQLEPGLTETIIKDVADAPGALPLLSQALLETWKRRQGETLTRSGYEASGGVQQAIAQTADKVYNEQLTSQQQAIARQIFLRLVELGESEQYDTRRRISGDELEDGASEVLVKLADARLIVTDQPSLNPSQQGQGSIEVAHEALIREWPTLRHWLDDDREGLRIHRHLTEAAQEWERLGRDTGDLYRGARLAQAREWAEQHANDLNALEQEFLQASQQAIETARREREDILRREATAERKAREEAQKREREQKRANTQWRRLATVLAVVFLLAVGIAFYANTKAQEALNAEATAEVARDEADQKAEEALEAQATADVARNEAEEAARLAIARQLVTEAQNAPENFPQRRLLLAVEGLQATMQATEATASAEQALRDALGSAGGIGLGDFRSATIPVGFSDNKLVAIKINEQERGTLLHAELPTNFPPDKALAFTPIDNQEINLPSDLPAFFIKSGDQEGLILNYFGFTYLSNLSREAIALFSRLMNQEEGLVYNMAISPDHQWLGTAHWLETTDGSFSFDLRLWNLQSQNPSAEFRSLNDVPQVEISWMGISPNNHWLATSSAESGTVQLWDLTAEEPSPPSTLLTLDEEESPSNSKKIGAFSSDNRWLAIGGWGWETYLWDLTRPMDEPIVFEGNVDLVAFSLNNRWLVTASNNQNAILWDLNADDPTAAPLALNDFSSPESRYLLSPDGHWLFYGGENGISSLWDLSADNPADQSFVLKGHEFPVSWAVFSPDNRWLVTSEAESDNREDVTQFRLWDLSLLPKTTAEPIVLGNQGATLNSVRSPDNSRQFFVLADQTGLLLDLTSPDPSQSPRFPPEFDKSPMAISPDNHWLATSKQDGTVQIWDLREPTAQPIVFATNTISPTISLEISSDKHWLATKSQDGMIQLWDLTSDEPPESLIVAREGDESSWASIVGFSLNNNFLLIQNYENNEDKYNLYRLNNDSHTKIILTCKEAQVLNQRYTTSSSDMRWVVSQSDDGTACLWDLSTSASTLQPIVLETDHEGDFGVHISPNNQWLVTAGHEDSTVRLWDLTQPLTKPVIQQSIPTSDCSYCLHIEGFSPDSRWLVIQSSDQSLIVWDLSLANSSVAPHIIRGDEESLFISVIGNGWLAIRQEKEDFIRLWELTMPSVPPRIIRTSNRQIAPWAISHDGDRLLTGDWNSLFMSNSGGMFHLWNLRLDELINLACRTAGRNLSQEEWRQYFGEQAYRKTCPDLPVHWSVVQALIEEGKRLGEEGDIDGARAKFQEAVALDPTLELDPEAEIKKITAQALVSDGIELAEKGDIDGARAKFQEAVALDPTLELDPEAESKKLATQTLVSDGIELAIEGEIEQALDKFAEAQALYPEVEIDGESWSILCRFGSLWGDAALVMDSCERAVELAPDDGPIRSRRGIGHAMMGDYAAALEDLHVYLEWLKERSNEEEIQLAESWIAELEAGRNPFDEEMREMLRERWSPN